MIELQNITKIYPGDIRAVDNVSFKVRKGEVLGLIGKSGCGKTTTLKMINRLIEPTGGKVLVNGENVLEKNPQELRLSIGYVIQHIGLFPHLTVRENLETVPKLLNWPEEKLQKRCLELMELISLDADEFLSKMPDQLSGGQQQRIGLARALAADPPVVLLDEPFGALDPITRENIREEFTQLQARIQKTMVMVTHDIFEAFELCDRICLLNEGKLQQVGKPAELLFNPESDFVKTFFDSNRFLLEMSILTVHDVVKFAEPVVTRADGLFEFKESLPFLKAFELIENRTKEAVCVNILNESGESKGVYNPEELFDAFYRARKAIK